MYTTISLRETKEKFSVFSETTFSAERDKGWHYLGLTA